jgi:5-formyltetrahydrofolate cyclo-ligase
VDETCREGGATALIQARKRQLRRSILALRRGLPAAERAARSRLIWDRISRLACYQRADLVLGYMAFDHEVLTDGLIRQAMASGKHIVLPIVQADRQQLALYAIEDFDRDLTPGYRGILEPRPRRARAVAPEALEPGFTIDCSVGCQGRSRSWEWHSISRSSRGCHISPTT